MADLDPHSSSPGWTLTFRRHGGTRSPRAYPFRTGCRRLADTLIEFPIEGTWNIDDLDAGVTLQSDSGRVLVIPADRHHELRMAPGRPMQSHWALIAVEDELGRDVLARLERAIVLPSKASHRASQLLTELATQPESTLSERVTFQRKALELVEIILTQSSVPSAALPSLAERRVENVLRFIRDHLNRPLTIRDLARHAHLSAPQFHHVFVSATGQAPMKYVTAQRMRRAQQLLLSTAMSCKEIGQHCGYVSAPHFSRTFTRSIGVTPLAYRAQIHAS